MLPQPQTDHGVPCLKGLAGGGNAAGDPQGSQLTAADVLGRDAQGRGILEQAHDLPAVQRDILYRIQADQVLEHTDHGGIIMAQDIQL